MDAARRGRLEVIPADAAMDQSTDAVRFPLGRSQRQFGTSLTDVARQRASRPKASLTYACHQFETSWRKAQPAIKRFEPFFELVGRDDLLGKDVTDRLETDVSISILHREVRELDGGKTAEGASSERKTPNLYDTAERRLRKPGGILA